LLDSGSGHGPQVSPYNTALSSTTKGGMY
jgi:hypothetical protein